MPTYTYKCETCEEVFDIHQSFSEKTLEKHAVCGQPVQKVFHAAGIVFKGSGFYKTDSRPKKKSSSSSKTESSSETKTSTKTETKSDSKSESSSKKKPDSKASSSEKKK